MGALSKSSAAANPNRVSLYPLPGRVETVPGAFFFLELLYHSAVSCSPCVAPPGHVGSLSTLAPSPPFLLSRQGHHPPQTLSLKLSLVFSRTLAISCFNPASALLLDKRELQTQSLWQLTSLTGSLPACKEYWGHRRVQVCHFIVATEIENWLLIFKTYLWAWPQLSCSSKSNHTESCSSPGIFSCIKVCLCYFSLT